MWDVVVELTLSCNKLSLHSHPIISDKASHPNPPATTSFSPLSPISSTQWTHAPLIVATKTDRDSSVCHNLLTPAQIIIKIIIPRALWNLKVGSEENQTQNGWKIDSDTHKPACTRSKSKRSFLEFSTDFILSSHSGLSSSQWLLRSSLIIQPSDIRE